MAINLSVVGLFFGAKLDLLQQDTRVIDVLLAAKSAVAKGLINNVTDFSFETTLPPNQSMTSFSATYAAPFYGRVIGNFYPAGEYSLSENTGSRPAYSVWQYYVLDADGLRVGGGGVRYLENPAAIVPANGTLIWRLVTILAEPKASSKLMAARMR